MRCRSISGFIDRFADGARPVDSATAETRLVNGTAAVIATITNIVDKTKTAISAIDKTGVKDSSCNT